MPYIKVQVTIYKLLGYSTLKEEVIVGSHEKESITKPVAIELFKKMVAIFCRYNGVKK